MPKDPPEEMNPIERAYLEGTAEDRYRIDTVFNILIKAAIRLVEEDKRKEKS